MLWLFVGPTGVYLLDFFCSGIQFNLLLSPYPCFISLLYLVVGEPKSRIVQKHTFFAPERYTAGILYTDSLYSA